jgi:hypothetical protein
VLSAPPATAAALCGCLADEAAAGKQANTLGLRLAAIRYFHRAAGHDTPTGERTIDAALVRKRGVNA